MDNPIGYLYRVGQSASRPYAVRPIPIDTRSVDAPKRRATTCRPSPGLAAAVGAPLTVDDDGTITYDATGELLDGYVAAQLCDFNAVG